MDSGLFYPPSSARQSRSGEHLSGCRDVQAGGEPERFSGNFGVRRRRYPGIGSNSRYLV